MNEIELEEVKGILEEVVTGPYVEHVAKCTDSGCLTTRTYHRANKLLKQLQGKEIVHGDDCNTRKE